jgi:hypothetical protein
MMITRRSFRGFSKHIDAVHLSNWMSRKTMSNSSGHSTKISSPLYKVPTPEEYFRSEKIASITLQVFCYLPGCLQRWLFSYRCRDLVPVKRFGYNKNYYNIEKLLTGRIACLISILIFSDYVDNPVRIGYHHIEKQIEVFMTRQKISVQINLPLSRMEPPRL